MDEYTQQLLKFYQGTLNQDTVEESTAYIKEFIETNLLNFIIGCVNIIYNQKDSNNAVTQQAVLYLTKAIEITDKQKYDSLLQIFAENQELSQSIVDFVIQVYQGMPQYRNSISKLVSILFLIQQQEENEMIKAIFTIATQNEDVLIAANDIIIEIFSNPMLIQLGFSSQKYMPSYAPFIFHSIEILKTQQNLPLLLSSIRLLSASLEKFSGALPDPETTQAYGEAIVNVMPLDDEQIFTTAIDAWYNFLVRTYINLSNIGEDVYGQMAGVIQGAASEKGTPKLGLVLDIIGKFAYYEEQVNRTSSMFKASLRYVIKPVSFFDTYGDALIDLILSSIEDRIPEDESSAAFKSDGAPDYIIGLRTIGSILRASLGWKYLSFPLLNKVKSIILEQGSAGSVRSNIIALTLISSLNYASYIPLDDTPSHRKYRYTRAIKKFMAEEIFEYVLSQIVSPVPLVRQCAAYAVANIYDTTKHFCIGVDGGKMIDQYMEGAEFDESAGIDLALAMANGFFHIFKRASNYRGFYNPIVTPDRFERAYGILMNYCSFEGCELENGLFEYASEAICQLVRAMNIESLRLHASDFVETTISLVRNYEIPYMNSNPGGYVSMMLARISTVYFSYKRFPDDDLVRTSLELCMSLLEENQEVVSEALLLLRNILIMRPMVGLEIGSGIVEIVLTMVQTRNPQIVGMALDIIGRYSPMLGGISATAKRSIEEEEDEGDVESHIQGALEILGGFAEIAYGSVTDILEMGSLKALRYMYTAIANVNEAFYAINPAAIKDGNDPFGLTLEAVAAVESIRYEPEEWDAMSHVIGNACSALSSLTVLYQDEFKALDDESVAMMKAFGPVSVSLATAINEFVTHRHGFLAVTPFCLLQYDMEQFIRLIMNESKVWNRREQRLIHKLVVNQVICFGESYKKVNEKARRAMEKYNTI